MIIGYQIVSNDGKNEMPDCFYSFEVIDDIGIAEIWLAMEKKNLEHGKFRWVLLPIFDGDIEEPTFVDSLSNKIKYGKVAKLVAVSMVTRIIIPENATDEDIKEKALPVFQERLNNEFFENLEFIELDEECPYGIICSDFAQ
jgi:hypothetical protein